MLDHWKFFAEFCRYEIAAGGPDPHMRLVGEICRHEQSSWIETAWRGLCYCSVYNVPTAVVLWTHWPAERVRATSVVELTEWLRNNWRGIAFRRERKAVRTPEKLARCLHSAAEWVRELPAKRMEGQLWFDPSLGQVARFEMAYDDACSVYGFGRYIGQKYVEYAHRYMGTAAAAYDIRPRGGWSPRAALALLFPEHEPALNGGDSPEELRIADMCAREARERLNNNGILLDWYLLQVLLCDYKQSAVGRRQYPGKSQDTEMEYNAKIAPHWGECQVMWDARRRIIPDTCLGELQGWHGVRKELGYVLTKHGYTWTDFLYDYLKSKDHLETPHHYSR